MKCENALDLLLDERDDDAAAKFAAEEHLLTCASCQDARYAAERLRALRAEPIPSPTLGARERALAAATSMPRWTATGSGATETPSRRLQAIRDRKPDPAPPFTQTTGARAGSAASSERQRIPSATLAHEPSVHPVAASAPDDTALGGSSRPARGGGFWLGMGVGGSLAAALALAWITFLQPQPQGQPPGAATPEVALTMNETRDVSISVDAPAALANAEIHVVLTGAIGLAGFDGQRELRWRTDLDAGSNQLTLPVVAFGSRGQLLVEVQHGAKRRTFVVDVRGYEA